LPVTHVAVTFTCDAVLEVTCCTYHAFPVLPFIRYIAGDVQFYVTFVDVVRAITLRYHHHLLILCILVILLPWVMFDHLNYTGQCYRTTFYTFAVTI